MNVNPFHGQASRLGAHVAEQEEHEAAVELLVFAEFADRLVQTREQEAIEAFTDAHGWDTPTFSYETYHRIAIAKVRQAIGSVEAENALLTEISGRITHADLRGELIVALRDLLPEEELAGNDLARRIVAALG